MSATTVDFGAPSDFGLHHFWVAIPAAPREAVRISEDYGFDGDEQHRETSECRVILARELWNKIRDDARRDFNARLKAKKQSTGTWKIGAVRLDRFLGRELCILAWATEHATTQECAMICQKWLALRPEERWWLYAKTASEARLAEQTERGWRKALYCALSDGEGVKATLKVKPKNKKKEDEDAQMYNLFDFL